MPSTSSSITSRPPSAMRGGLVTSTQVSSARSRSTEVVPLSTSTDRTWAWRWSRLITWSTGLPWVVQVTLTRYSNASRSQLISVREPSSATCHKVTIALGVPAAG
jgi:hypothetical protein